MKQSRIGRTARWTAGLYLMSSLLLCAADNSAATQAGNAGDTPATAAAAATPTASDIEQLKQMILNQQQQINQLRQELAGKEALAPAAPAAPNFPSTGQVASTVAVVPAASRAIKAEAAPLPIPQQPVTAQTTPGNPCEANSEGSTPPTFIHLGSTCLVPVGFMDLTSVWRDKNAASGMGSNFGSIPFNNTVNGNLSEFRFTPQNSRIGFRFDGDWKGAHFIGYNEFDFNGTSGSNGIGVSNGAFVPRLRLFWVDVRKHNIEFLAGQSWSLMTPNRKGLSALPGDLFYTQVIDINYMAGLTWTRQPGMRVLFHGASDKVTFGFSAENPDQYAGGSAGGSGITLPTAYASLANAQLDVSQNVSSGQNILTQPTVTPDFIAKLALDPTSRFHFEVGGVERNFKIVNPSNLGQHFSASGGGLLVGLNGEIFKGFRLISTNFWSDGGGRYLFGQAPDLIVRANGNLSLVRSGGTIDGFEARMGKLLLYGYYGGIFIGRDAAVDANGTTKIGYGYVGSPNSQNRSINEFTFGFNQTMWASPRYGAVNFMGQYEYLTRDPWYVALNAPKNTHDNTIYFNVRYTLPGNMPNF